VKSASLFHFLIKLGHFEFGLEKDVFEPLFSNTHFLTCFKCFANVARKIKNLRNRPWLCSRGAGFSMTFVEPPRGT